MATIAAVFWPIVQFWSYIEFDAALFVTEWLKLLFSSIILFAAVEILLHRQREQASEQLLRRLVEAEVTAPLRAAADLTADAVDHVRRMNTYDASRLCDELRALFRRATAALYHAPLIAPGSNHGIRARRLAAALAEYSWERRLDEFETLTEWGPANVDDLSALNSHLRALVADSATLAPLEGQQV